LVRFDTDGFRTDVSLDIVELNRDGLNMVGRWSSKNGVNSTRNNSNEQQTIVHNLHNQTLIITTVLADPYMMLRQSSRHLQGNERYEGFCTDLLKEISTTLGFTYTINIVDGGQHGRLNEKKGTWDGITILYRKPLKKRPSLFSFLWPLSLEVWLYVATAYLGVSLMLFIIARLSPYEWVVPEDTPKKEKKEEEEKKKKKEEEEKEKKKEKKKEEKEEKEVKSKPTPSFVSSVTPLENQYSLTNSLWFTLGSLLQQGTEQQPRAVSTRMVAALWWFFTLIMVSSYTANLAAFLTVERMESPIESAHDLAKQTKIKYGSMFGGSTWNFFASSQLPTYQRMYHFMESQTPPVYTHSNEEGVRKVRSSEDGLYAYMMESSSIEYITERYCDLMQVGGLLDTKGYGIALPPGSPYTNTISEAVLSLQENGKLLELRTMWWKRKHGGGQCKVDEVKGSSKANELDLDNVGGVFVVLLAGMALASIVAMCEFLWKSRKLAIHDH
ncbi:hypothetical protein Pmani_036002, partial [Petrolisthes manimaculis]